MILKNDLFYTKSEARQQAKKARNALTDCEVSEHSFRIFHTVMAMEEYKNSDTVLTYADCNNEVSTGHFINLCLEEGKKVALPRVESKGTMNFYYISNDSELIPGKYGILEPSGDRKFIPEESSCAIMIMPGVAFDSHCHRVGYGGGYYDRYLMEHPQITTIAVCHDVQILDNILTEEYDICPDILISENKKYVKNTCIYCN